jgi:hypothetical protein
MFTLIYTYSCLLKPLKIKPFIRFLDSIIVSCLQALRVVNSTTLTNLESNFFIASMLYLKILD